MLITIVAAINQKYTIGKDGKLPWNLPKDLKHFMHYTLNKPIIMGRLTFESLGKPLKNRDNIIVTSKKINTPGILCFSSLELALDAFKDRPEVIIGGGHGIYKAALPYATKMVLTWVDSDDEGDAYFPQFEMSDWQRQSIEHYPQYEHHTSSFAIETLIRS